jgi:acetyl-CoA carboxylase alpha subunit
LAWAEELAGAEEERPEFFELARFWYRDLMILAAQGGEHHLVHTDLKEELHRRVGGRGPETFISALREIDFAEEALESMVRPDLVMENLMFNLSQIQEG